MRTRRRGKRLRALAGTEGSRPWPHARYELAPATRIAHDLRVAERMAIPVANTMAASRTSTLALRLTARAHLFLLRKQVLAFLNYPFQTLKYERTVGRYLVL